jgi:spore germination protein
VLACCAGPATVKGAEVPRGAALRWAYYVPDDPSSLASLRQRSGDLDYVGLHWAAMKEDGSVDIKSNPEVIRLVRSIGAKPLLSIALSGGAETGRAILANDSSRTVAVNALSAALSDYDGISIDFEGLYPQERDPLTRFMAQLAGQLRPAGKLVTMALSAKSSDSSTGWAGAHDYAGLAPNADLFVVMAYGFRTGNSSVPGPAAPMSWVADSISFAVSQIPPEKILLGIPLYGYDWDTTSGPPGRALRYPDAIAIANQQGVSVDHDLSQQCAHFSYTKDGNLHEVWFEDRATAETKLALVARHKLAGVAAWRLGHEDPRVWQSINALRQANPGQAVASPQAAPEFKLGFRLIADQIPDIAGNPVENERFEGQRGNSIQRTVNPKRLTSTGLPREGMMVWRKSDNWTAFTDGWTTWVNGPNGLQSRLNSERFPWEGDSVAPSAGAPPQQSYP